MFSFFAEHDRHHRPRHTLLEHLEPQQILWLLRTFLENESAMTAFERYARAHKQAVYELSEDDVKAVQALLQVHTIQES